MKNIGKLGNSTEKKGETENNMGNFKKRILHSGLIVESNVVYTDPLTTIFESQVHQ